MWKYEETHGKKFLGNIEKKAESAEKYLNLRHHNLEVNFNFVCYL